LNGDQISIEEISSLTYTCDNGNKDDPEETDSLTLTMKVKPIRPAVKISEEE